MGTAGAVVAVAFLVVTVFAATVLVAVRLPAGLFAATLFRYAGLAGADHQRHTLFLEDLVEAAQYVLPLSGRNLVSFEGPTHVIAGDLPSAFPRSMSAMTETDSAISGGSVRDVLADANNLSERWKTASGPSTATGADDRRLGDGSTARAGAGKMHSAVGTSRPYSLPGCHLLGHRAVAEERYAQSAWPVTPR